MENTSHTRSSSENDLINSEEMEHKVIRDIINTFKDLREYSQDVEHQLNLSRKASIRDHIKESRNISNLHRQILSCDNILKRMESMLVGFQNDLGNISSEIVSLQRKSITMSQELSNRQSIRGQMSQFIDDMAIPDNLITCIMELPVTDKDFIINLRLLNHKIGFVKEQSFKEVASCQDVKDVLYKLKVKAMGRIREYLLEQIYKFRKPLANYQVPQNNMLKYKYFYEFILSNERNVAQEIYNEYVDTMSKIYFSYFKSYNNRLVKLKYEEDVSKDDLMGIEDSASRGIFNKSMKMKGTVFTIGKRGNILSQHIEAPILVPHAQLRNKFPYEELFRSEQYALVDNACREYLFICEFYMLKGQQAKDTFEEVLGKTTSMLQKAVSTHIENCYDSIALFLCYHLIIRYKIMCHKRCVPTLDSYWEYLESIILARFEHVCTLNIISIRDCDPTKFPPEVGPHYITRRYAEFSGALVGISESFPNEIVNKLLADLQEEVELFILRMAGIFPQRKEQLIFLINNYDMVLTIIMEHTRDNSKEAETFKSRLSAKSAEYVDEVLSPYFGEIVQYVRESETLMLNGELNQWKNMDKKVPKLVQLFSDTWKNSLEVISREVLISFPNLVTGSSLLQLVFTQLVQYYHRFHKLLPLSMRSQLTNVHVIMSEMKKYVVNYN